MLDEAILSRVMLRLEYPHLDATTRAAIWQSMFAAAQLRTDGYSFEALGVLDLNGRQIRNITRLAKILNPDGHVTRDGIHEALQFGASVSLWST